ncbi:MAG: hypothetical protein OK449_07755 [Thaumarchaeota archaeon]|nr:hypothetical protein [Nitrososphaerota archaeon]
MSLDVNSYLNLFIAVIIIGVSLPTLYISRRIKIKTVKTLFTLLSAFLVVHGLYHLTYFIGDYTNSNAIAFGDELLQPLSYVILLAFAIYFAKSVA